MGTFLDRLQDARQKPVGQWTGFGLIDETCEKQIQLRAIEQPAARRAGVANEVQERSKVKGPK